MSEITERAKAFILKSVPASNSEDIADAWKGKFAEFATAEAAAITARLADCEGALRELVAGTDIKDFAVATNSDQVAAYLRLKSVIERAKELLGGGE